MDVGSAPFHTIGAIFCRGNEGDLLSIEGRDAKLITKHWSLVGDVRNSHPTTPTSLPSKTEISTIRFPAQHFWFMQKDEEQPEYDTCTLREYFDEKKNCFVGLISYQHSTKPEEEVAFQEWLENFILLETTLTPNAKESVLKDEEIVKTADTVTELFSNYLRNTASHDEWDQGVDLFRNRILHYVARNGRIQMALPAFPCKSPSDDKVGTDEPDLAERLALQTLQAFARKVKDVYTPGVELWIISDGHVFSDCIGVDDDMVVEYNQKLAAIYRESVAESKEDLRAIRFWGLSDMFVANSDVRDTTPQKWVDDFELDHLITSTTSTEAENARKIMMAGFQGDRENFRRLLKEHDEATTSLYRGQARFMQDDISTPEFLEKSKKQQKKTSFKVAEEMIARNQAYSNLLELLLPNFVRLSIHAHTNKGPKFGICLFPQEKVKAIESLNDRHEHNPNFEFQMPTPWHNSIVKVEGDDKLYLTKKSTVDEAIEKGDFEGGWVDDAEEGGHFKVRPINSEEPSPMLSPASTPSSTFVASDHSAPSSPATSAHPPSSEASPKLSASSSHEPLPEADKTDKADKNSTIDDGDNSTEPIQPGLFTAPVTAPRSEKIDKAVAPTGFNDAPVQPNINNEVTVEAVQEAVLNTPQAQSPALMARLLEYVSHIVKYVTSLTAKVRKRARPTLKRSRSVTIR